MIKKTFILLPALSLVFFTACNNNPENQADNTTGDNEQLEVETDSDTTENQRQISDNYQRGDLNIYPKEESVQFEDASLKLNKPKDGASVNGNQVSFDFGVENYELGKATSDAEGNGLANSGHGQHIHLIVDNGPYSAHYEPTFQREVDPGNHVAIAFLSRSYHESVKNDNSFVVFQFSNGEGTSEEAAEDLSQPLLFYSRPKGEYKGKDAEKILFDFYLHNTDLSENGNMVKLTINGEEEFMFAEWKPYVVEGLPSGENTFTIELVDQNGELVGSDFNRVNRTFTLSK